MARILKSRSKAKGSKSKTRKPSAKRAKKAKSPKRSKFAASTPAAAFEDIITTSNLLLPERFDSSTAKDVLESFLARRGQALVVDASGVRRVGAQSLQILVSAGRTWKTDGCELCVKNPSQEFLEAASLLGLPHADLAVEGSLL